MKRRNFLKSMPLVFAAGKQVIKTLVQSSPLPTGPDIQTITPSETRGDALGPSCHYLKFEVSGMTAASDPFYICVYDAP